MNCLVDDVITYTSVMEKEIMIHGDKVKKQYVFLSSAIGTVSSKYEILGKALCKS